MQTIILTGGESRRMQGLEKAMLDAGDGPLSLVLARRYRQELGPVAFSVDRKGRFPCDDFPELEDAFPGRGPFNGLYSAFRHTQEEYVFLTATDMPGGSPALALYLLDQIQEKKADICAIRRQNGFLEPLFSIYRRTCLPVVRECLEAEKLSLLELYARAKVHELSEEALPQWDLDETFYNVNTPQEYARLLRKLGKENRHG